MPLSVARQKAAENRANAAIVVTTARRQYQIRHGANGRTVRRETESCGGVGASATPACARASHDLVYGLVPPDSRTPVPTRIRTSRILALTIVAAALSAPVVHTSGTPENRSSAGVRDPKSIVPAVARAASFQLPLRFEQASRGRTARVNGAAGCGAGTRRRYARQLPRRAAALDIL